MATFHEQLSRGMGLFKEGATVYSEQVCVLALRQDPSKVDKTRTLVCDTLAFLSKIDTELNANIQAVLLEAAKRLLG